MIERPEELTQKERRYLIGVLTERLGIQREGVYHSEVASFKDDMKQEESQIRLLITKLELEPTSKPTVK